LRNADVRIKQTPKSGKKVKHLHEAAASLAGDRGGVWDHQDHQPPTPTDWFWAGSTTVWFLVVEQQPMFQIRNILWLQPCSAEDTEGWADFWHPTNIWYLYPRLCQSNSTL